MNGVPASDGLARLGRGRGDGRRLDSDPAAALHDDPRETVTAMLRMFLVEQRRWERWLSKIEI